MLPYTVPLPEVVAPLLVAGLVVAWRTVRSSSEGLSPQPAVPASCEEVFGLVKVQWLSPQVTSQHVCGKAWHTEVCVGAVDRTCCGGGGAARRRRGSCSLALVPAAAAVQACQAGRQPDRLGRRHAAADVLFRICFMAFQPYTPVILHLCAAQA